MVDLDRYEVAGPLLLCRTCRADSTRFIVKSFPRRTIDMTELHAEMLRHENEHHEAALENDAEKNAEVAGRAARTLLRRSVVAARELRESKYYACYPTATAYRDGMVNGMGGAAGDMAGLLGPDAVRALSKALEQVVTVSKECPELIQDHDRESCSDLTCDAYGHLIAVARAIDGQLSAE
ncbi:hypothetical protein ACFW2V_12430 [Streptomyces sp. NPDC058947]|uniref:hypothetical protein n=1 Tax=Streptomyces sp. NPDC058947 TaxID=3346675 RepID=UPI0036AC5447